MMERYLEVKGQNPGSLLLFRMGDFYELFYDDAQLAARVLGLTLTSRDKGSSNPVPMAGFPYHALDSYLQKLIESGLRVAICEQVEDPKLAKGLVRREVTRIVTPGTLVDEGLLDPRRNNFLASVFPAKNGLGLAWLELSTGRFFAAQVEQPHLVDELARIQPAECLVPDEALPDRILAALVERQGMLISRRPPWNFARQECRRLLWPTSKRRPSMASTSTKTRRASRRRAPSCNTCRRHKKVPWRILSAWNNIAAARTS